MLCESRWLEKWFTKGFFEGGECRFLALVISFFYHFSERYVVIICDDEITPTGIEI